MAAESSPPSLPSIQTLHSQPRGTVFNTLDLLFEPSTALHAVVLDIVCARPYPSYADLVEAIRARLLHLAEALLEAGPVVSQQQQQQQKQQEREEEEGHPRTQPRESELYRILGSHPRLGEPKKEALSAQSAAEQRSLREGGPTDEALRLAALNREYEERFPGLRYVVFVNGRSRAVIMDDMRRRIDRGDVRAEEREAINAMCDIAIDRAGKLPMAAS